MAVIPTQKIYKMIKNGDLRIHPFFKDTKLKGSTLDLRLGTTFLFFQKEFLSYIDPSEKISPSVERYYFIRPGKSVVIHPGDFILGTTLEYISLPKNILAFVEGRSSWGRLGLFIATATIVNPGYKGIITLELVNSGAVPLHLYPGVRIAQLVFHSVEGKGDINPYEKKKSKFLGSLKPIFSKICDDPEWDIIRKIKSQ